MFDLLYPFQKKDVTKLGPLPFGLVANDMGTGKTVEGIALDQVHRQVSTGKTLVLTPLSVRFSWEAHYEKFTDLRVRVIDPKKRELFLKQDADIYVMHYDVLRLMPELAKIKWLHIICDECQRVQNRPRRNKAGKISGGFNVAALWKIKAQFRTAMSGTPYSNIDKFWGVLKYLDPRPSTKGGFGSHTKYYNDYVPWYPDWSGYKKILTMQAAEAFEDTAIKYNFPSRQHAIDYVLDKEAALQERIEPFTVRHTLREVRPEMPVVTDSIRYVELYPEQRAAYDQMAKHSIAFVGDHQDQPIASPVVISQLTRLQQFADAYATVVVNPVSKKKTLKLTKPSAKIDAALELLEEIPEEQVVFFSRFTKMLNLFDTELRREGISFEKLTGEVPDKLRPGMIKRFQAKESRCFLISIKAGGVGIDLTSANIGAFFDREWNAVPNAQAVGRLDRIGQTRPVLIVDLVAMATAEPNRLKDLQMSWQSILRLLEPKKFSS